MDERGGYRRCVRVRLGLIIAVFLLAPLACGNDSTPGSAQQDGGRPEDSQATIKIGVLLPLSGGNAEAGANMLDAAKLAADDVNAADGVLGRRIEIISGDDGCSPEMATAAAANILATGIVGIAGGYCSGAAIPASAVTDS
ncbi:MAG TPA: ABC transporter substrate-binding protein, partial [Acidimicrobiia bacterium]|nr:ABC transporter substrate-binding protein [Acidimicrobiia bacterium]